MAPGFAGEAFANRRHLFSVEGTLPEVLDWDRRVSGCDDRKVIQGLRVLPLLVRIGVVYDCVQAYPPKSSKLLTRGELGRASLAIASSLCGKPPIMTVVYRWNQIPTS